MAGTKVGKCCLGTLSTFHRGPGTVGVKPQHPNLQTAFLAGPGSRILTGPLSAVRTGFPECYLEPLSSLRTVLRTPVPCLPTCNSCLLVPSCLFFCTLPHPFLSSSARVHPPVGAAFAFSPVSFSLQFSEFDLSCQVFLDRIDFTLRGCFNRPLSVCDTILIYLCFS